MNLTNKQLEEIEKKIRVVPHGVNLEVFYPENKTITREVIINERN